MLLILFFLFFVRSWCVNRIFHNWFLLRFQHKLLKHDFLKELLHILPELNAASVGPLYNTKTPQLRQVVALGLAQSQGSVQAWDAFIERGDDVPDAVLDDMMADVYPAA